LQFTGEENVWHGIPEFNLLAQNISLPGISMRYSHVHYTADGGICQLTTDEGEINPAVTTIALALSPLFNLTRMYFLPAGDAGISLKVGTLTPVAFSCFSI
jgi:purine nucleoside permease